MFVENYRRADGETLMAGNDAFSIPYPRISAEDWKAWKMFLPFLQETFNPQYAKALGETLEGPLGSRGIPPDVVSEINKAADVFPRIEIWRKQRIDKDPIAVGVIGRDRYLIARWGMEKLIPFDTIKRRAPLIALYRTVVNPMTVAAAISVSLACWILL